MLEHMCGRHLGQKLPDKEFNFSAEVDGIKSLEKVSGSNRVFHKVLVISKESELLRLADRP